MLSQLGVPQTESSRALASYFTQNLMMSDTDLQRQDLETFDKLIPPLDLFLAGGPCPNWQELLVDQASFNILVQQLIEKEEQEVRQTYQLFLEEQMQYEEELEINKARVMEDNLQIAATHVSEQVTEFIHADHKGTHSCIETETFGIFFDLLDGTVQYF